MKDSSNTYLDTILHLCDSRGVLEKHICQHWDSNPGPPGSACLSLGLFLISAKKSFFLIARERLGLIEIQCQAANRLKIKNWLRNNSYRDKVDLRNSILP